MPSIPKKIFFPRGELFFVSDSRMVTRDDVRRSNFRASQARQVDGAGLTLRVSLFFHSALFLDIFCYFFWKNGQKHGTFLFSLNPFLYFNF